MARAYDEAVASRRAELGSDAAAQADVFAGAYKIAVQVMDLRAKHGLTQAQLAQRCDMSQADISRIERGSTSPTTRTLQRIADALAAEVRLVDRTELDRVVETAQ
ncbi:helix-turn-helix domain-containing protein [Candidatus Poriferisodalis sp.]|uniref:helix-turn-helix domain-containing protein n=1 Tax=Candidatus Poriferisodalis sp. TaxID=3101277 RepID=UPI003B01E91A